MNIVLIGGGNAAVTILDHFRNISGHSILGVVDIRDDAPGILRARELGIVTSSDMKKLVERDDVDLIIEITGVSSVLEQVKEFMQERQSLINACGARLMINLIDAQNEHNTTVVREISEKFKVLTDNLEGTIKTIDESHDSVVKLTREGYMISINAKVQAAHAGKEGWGFEAVVNGIISMVQQIETAIQSINIASMQTHDVLDEFHRAEENLCFTFARDTSSSSGSSEIPCNISTSINSVEPGAM